MLHRIRISGAGAAIYWGYRHVADLGPWESDSGILTAVVESCDAFLITQGGLSFVPRVPPDRPPVRRPLADVVVANGVLTATLVSTRHKGGA